MSAQNCFLSFSMSNVLTKIINNSFIVKHTHFLIYLCIMSPNFALFFICLRFQKLLHDNTNINVMCLFLCIRIIPKIYVFNWRQLFMKALYCANLIRKHCSWQIEIQKTDILWITTTTLILFKHVLWPTCHLVPLVTLFLRMLGSN